MPTVRPPESPAEPQAVPPPEGIGKRGLTTGEAARRLAVYGPHELTEKERSTLLTFLGSFWGPIPWMIEAAVVLSLLVGDFTDFGIIGILLVSNAFVGFWVTRSFTGTRRARIRIPSGPDRSATRMTARVKAAPAGWRYDAVSIGYPGRVANGRPAEQPHNLGAGWKRFDLREASPGGGTVIDADLVMPGPERADIFSSTREEGSAMLQPPGEHAGHSNRTTTLHSSRFTGRVIRGHFQAGEKKT